MLPSGVVVARWPQRGKKPAPASPRQLTPESSHGLAGWVLLKPTQSLYSLESYPRNGNHHNRFC
jgi:hypothetical protein